MKYVLRIAFALAMTFSGCTSHTPPTESHTEALSTGGAPGACTLQMREGQRVLEFSTRVPAGAVPARLGLSDSIGVVSGDGHLHQVVELGGRSLFTVDSQVPAQGTARLEMQLGSAFHGMSRMILRSDGTTAYVEIDGRPMLPFPAGTVPAAIEFADGGPSPVVTVDPGALDAILSVETAAGGQLPTCLGHGAAGAPPSSGSGPTTRSDDPFLDACTSICGVLGSDCDCCQDCCAAEYEICAAGAEVALAVCVGATVGTGSAGCYVGYLIAEYGCHTRIVSCQNGCVSGPACCEVPCSGGTPTESCRSSCSPGAVCCGGTSCCDSAADCCGSLCLEGSEAGFKCVNPDQGLICADDSGDFCGDHSSFQCCPGSDPVCRDRGQHVCCEASAGDLCPGPGVGVPGEPNPSLTCCPADAPRCTTTPFGFQSCCRDGSTVCRNGDCCSPPGTCAGDRCCSPPNTVCGDNCCGEGESCTHARNICCGGVFTTACGEDCCLISEQCIGGQCCPPAQACGSVCCSGNEVCLDPASGTCGQCQEEVACAQVGGGPPMCCPSGVECCGGTCCAANEICCADPHQAISCHDRALGCVIP